MTIPKDNPNPITEELRYGIWSPSMGCVSANLYRLRAEAVKDMEDTITDTLNTSRKLGNTVPAELEKSIRDHYKVVEVYVKVINANE